MAVLPQYFLIQLVFNSYLRTYYVLESRHRRDRDRHRQPLILNWAGHPTSTTPTNNNNHVELAHAQLVSEVAKKIRARFARGKYLYTTTVCKHPPFSNPGYAPVMHFSALV